jgi:hypothetical protein
VDKKLGATVQSFKSRSNSGYNSLVVTPRITAERKDGRMTVQWEEVEGSRAKTLEQQQCPDPLRV